MSEYLFLGMFSQESNKMVISDPSYRIDDVNRLGLGIVVDNAMVGTWYSWVRHNDRRCQELVAIYCDEPNENNTEIEDYVDNENWQEFENDISVDSGQAGIYDLKHFNKSDLVDEFNKNNNAECKDWYDMNCHCTLNLHAGIVPHGVVSRSGYGDGMYKVYYLKDDNKVKGIKIIFIDDDDSEGSDLVPPYYLK